MTGEALSRREAKDRTRRRLLRAALRILDEEGPSGLSTGRVARLAGVAQSTFYVHFRDKGALLRALGAEANERLDKTLREARRASREHPDDRERHRDTFRVPLEAIRAHPALFRLGLRARHDPASPVRSYAQALADANRAHLAEDLVALGLPTDTAQDRRRVEMIAEGLTALTEALALGHLEGRYPDLEEVIDVLVSFTRGYRQWLPRQPVDGGAGPGSPAPPASPPGSAPASPPGPLTQARIAVTNAPPDGRDGLRP